MAIADYMMVIIDCHGHISDYVVIIVDYMMVIIYFHDNSCLSDGNN